MIEYLKQTTRCDCVVTATANAAIALGAKIMEEYLTTYRVIVCSDLFKPLTLISWLSEQNVLVCSHSYLDHTLTIVGIDTSENGDQFSNIIDPAIARPTKMLWKQAGIYLRTAMYKSGSKIKVTYRVQLAHQHN